ncbi:hypothetical protein NXS19_012121 [Fusarium pseudograminearum]|nr:hypothetical protein NXS19_012121 [Fusarium pseudograminearum]
MQSSRAVKQTFRHLTAGLDWPFPTFGQAWHPPRSIRVHTWKEKSMDDILYMLSLFSATPRARFAIG